MRLGALGLHTAVTGVGMGLRTCRKAGGMGCAPLACRRPAPSMYGPCGLLQSACSTCAVGVCLVVLARMPGRAPGHATSPPLSLLPRACINKIPQALKRKAEERNPDEFYFAMEKARTKDGVHEGR
mgnify:CR=1 FL=1